MRLPIFTKRIRKDTPSFLEEINDLKTTIKKLEEDRQMLALVQDAENYAFFEYNYHTKELTPSVELFKNLGYEEREIPKSIYELSKFVHSDDIPTIKANILNKCIKKKSIHRFKCRIISKSKR